MEVAIVLGISTLFYAICAAGVTFVVGSFMGVEIPTIKGLLWRCIVLGIMATAGNFIPLPIMCGVDPGALIMITIALIAFFNMNVPDDLLEIGVFLVGMSIAGWLLGFVIVIVAIGAAS